jgi:hypothetical protein
MTLTPEEKIILASVKIHPDQADIDIINKEIPDVTNWEYFAKTITERGIAPLFHIKVALLSNAGLIPDFVIDKVRKVYFKTMSRGMLLYAHFKEIATAFEKENIPMIPMKGVYLAEKMYHDIALRQFSDMDLLVSPENGEKCLQILKKIGYKSTLIAQTEFVQSLSEIVHYPPMVKNEISVEIHIKLHRNHPEYFLDPVKIFEHAQTDILNNCKVLKMDKYDMLIHLCLHLDKHFVGGSLQFTCYNDIVNYLNTYITEFDWNEMEKRVSLYQATNQVYLHLMISNKYFHLHLPDDVVTKFNHLLTDKSLKLFVNHLNGKSVSQSFVPAHLEYIGKTEGLKNKWKYFKDVTFPSKKFIRSKYKLKDNNQIYWYYFLRLLTGLKGLLNMIFRKS